VATAIDYEKLWTEVVYINLPGPEEPVPGMSGAELLHGYLSDLNQATSPEVKNYINSLCVKWNIRYRTQKR